MVNECIASHQVSCPLGSFNNLIVMVFFYCIVTTPALTDDRNESDDRDDRHERDEMVG